MKSKTEIFLKTLGLIILGGVFSIIIISLDNSMTGEEQRIDELIKDVFMLIALLLVTIGGFYIIKYKEIPQPSLPSTTGGRAVFIGLVLILISFLAEIEMINEIMRLLLD